MFHMCGFYEDIDTAVMAYITAIADPTLRIVGDDLIVPDGINQLMAYFAFGTTITQAQLLSPSLRRLALQDISPVNEGAEPVDTQFPAVFHDLFDRPIVLDVSEALNAQINQALGAAEDETVFIWLGNGIDPLPTGQMFTVRCTNTTTLVAYAWTNGALTFSQTLPAGRYAVVGMRACSTGMCGARLVFTGGDWRPGCVGIDDVGDQDLLRFRYGASGSWGEFEHDLPPTVDFWSVSADTAQTVHLDLIQVRAGRRV